VSALLAIDPGTTHSGWVSAQVIYSEGGSPPILVLGHGIAPNVEVIDMIRGHVGPVAIERLVSYGMPVGAETFETVEWVGRFWQTAGVERTRLIPRKEVGKHVCNDGRAKDPNIRIGLINRWGGKAEAVGTVKKPGPLYGIKTHAWAALGVAVTAAET
jgi:hypothetical protein